MSKSRHRNDYEEDCENCNFQYSTKNFKKRKQLDSLREQRIEVHKQKAANLYTSTATLPEEE